MRTKGQEEMEESGDEVDAIAGSANVWGRNIGR